MIDDWLFFDNERAAFQLYWFAKSDRFDVHVEYQLSFICTAEGPQGIETRYNASAETSASGSIPVDWLIVLWQRESSISAILIKRTM
jgi:hypothetical protein